MSNNNKVNFLSETIRRAKNLKRNADKSIDQLVDDNLLFHFIDEESNSIALLIKHITGNMWSRWSDFLQTDGEKPDRNRPTEFDQSWIENKSELLKRWENGWKYFFNALKHYTIKDLNSNIFMKGEKLSLYEVIYTEMMHYAVHVGQIIFLVKHYLVSSWETLTIPRDYVWDGKS